MGKSPLKKNTSPKTKTKNKKKTVPVKKSKTLLISAGVLGGATLGLLGGLAVKKYISRKKEITPSNTPLKPSTPKINHAPLTVAETEREFASLKKQPRTFLEMIQDSFYGVSIQRAQIALLNRAKVLKIPIETSKGHQINILLKELEKQNQSTKPPKSTKEFLDNIDINTMKKIFLHTYMGRLKIKVKSYVDALKNIKISLPKPSPTTPENSPVKQSSPKSKSKDTDKPSSPSKENSKVSSPSKEKNKSPKEVKPFSPVKFDSVIKEDVNKAIKKILSENDNIDDKHNFIKQKLEDQGYEKDIINEALKSPTFEKILKQYTSLTIPKYSTKNKYTGTLSPLSLSNTPKISNKFNDEDIDRMIQEGIDSLNKN
jgi:hypothetical protein